MEYRFLLPIQEDMLPYHPDLGPLHPWDARLQGTDAQCGDALISYWYWRNRRFRFGEDVYLFGDSGGYNVLSEGARIDPRRAVRWQLDNVSAGCIQDVPPLAEKRGHRPVPFNEALMRTGTQRPPVASPLHEGPSRRISFWTCGGVVHGETRARMEEWHRGVSGSLPLHRPGRRVGH